MTLSRWKSTSLLFFSALIVCASALGAPVRLTVQHCRGTMSSTTHQGVDRITIGNPNPILPPNGGCALQGTEINVRENPVFDFWIRVQGTHTAAFNLAFGEGGLNYPGYKSHEDHVINIVGTQVGMASLGDLGEVNDSQWRHVVFDLGYAIHTQLGLDPAKIDEASLAIFDYQGSLDLFSGAPSQPFPTTIELRDMLLRPRNSGERFFNDLSFSVSSAAIGTSDNGRKYLIGGSVVARQSLDSLKVVVGSESRTAASEAMGTVQGRRNFAFVVSVPSQTSEVEARLVAADGKELAARKLSLQPELTYLKGATINIIPNSHNDIGWLDSPEATANWRRDQVIGPAIALLEKYPDYRYGMETNQYLMEYLNRVPTQAELIRKLIAEGRLTFGATYNQPYESLWRGESLVRELYYGRKWLRENLGPEVDTVTAWGTDVPSVSLQFPQVLAKSGVKYLTLGRFRPGIFDWYSPDGSKVTVGSLGIYGRLSAYLTPYDPVNVSLQLPGLLRNWDDFYRQHNIPPQFPITNMTDYLPPTKELIPLQQEWESSAGQKFGVQLKMKFATGEGFMDSVTRDPATKFPELHGEWPNDWAYIHGPTHHWTVSAGREAVWNLIAAEKFWTLRNLLSHGNERYPTETFDQAWMAQIYPDHGFGGFNGDLTDAVFDAKENEARIMGRALLDSSVEWVADHATSVAPGQAKLVILNPLSWDRSGLAWAEIPTPENLDAVVTDANGRALTSQRVPQAAGGTTRYILETRDIPAVGYSTFAVDYKPQVAKTALLEEFKTKTFENDFYRLEFSPGGLKSIYDKQLGKELLKPEQFLAGEVFMLDSPGHGASELGDFQQPLWEKIEKASQYQPAWRLIESGPVRTGWVMEQPFKEATVRLEVYAYQHFKQLDFDVQILHWSGEKNKEFRMAIPANMPAGQVAYEVPYGVLEVQKDEIEGIPFPGWYSRPARELHPREVQDWISVDDGKSTIMVSSSVAVWDYLDSQEKNDRLTLLQPILLASRRSCHGLGNWYLQKGDHSYHFSLTSFAGHWRNNVRFGNEVNSPFPAVMGEAKGRGPSIPSSLSMCKVSQPNYIVSTMKVADDQKGIIVRGYEIAGRHTDVTLKFPFDIQRANDTSLIEEDLSSSPETSGREVQFKAGHRSINALRVIGRWNPSGRAGGK